MKSRSLRILFTFLLVNLSVAPVLLHAQDNIKGSLHGTVTDAASDHPLEYANVVLLRNDSVMGGTLTDKAGGFTLPVGKPGQYSLRVEFIGYKALKQEHILVSAVHPEVNLGKIAIEADAKVLNEVVIQGQQATFVQTVDKKVFNVDKSVLATGGSAADVLQQIPSVSLDVDGNVELRGSSNVTVLIDGKPSGLAGPNLASILQQIPASSIESIELITNPSVKYDPDGMSGIINIVLKKNKKPGTNGSVSLSVSNRDKYNGSGIFNYRSGKFNVSASYSYRHNNQYGYGNSLRGNFFADTTWYLSQSEFSNRVSNTHMGRLGFDFYLNDKNTLSLGATYTGTRQDNDERTDYQDQDIQRNTFATFYRAGTELEKDKTLDLTADYRKTFKQKGRLLTANMSYSQNDNPEYEDYGQYYTMLGGRPVLGNPYLQQTTTLNPFQVASIQADYTQPLKGKAKIEAGYKTILRQTGQDFYSQHYNYDVEQWTPDTSLNNDFTYKEGVHALYGAFTNSKGKFTYQVGLRAEQAFTSSELRNDTSRYTNNYLSLFPNLQLVYNIKQEQSAQLSFSRRINRPRLHALNPFPDYDDPLNFRSGNPYLQPEYINSVELGYSRFFKKVSLTSSLYYRYITGMVTYVRSVDTTGISRTGPVNLNNSTNTGMELIARITPVKWWSITLNGNFFYAYLNATNIESSLTNSNFSWMGKILSNTTLSKGFQLQLSAFYHGPNVLPQGIMRAMYSADAGLKKDILKGKGSLGFSVSDIFNTRRFSISGEGENFTTEFTRRRESRIATLSFTYRFGKGDEAQRKNRRPGSETEGGDDDF